MFHYIPPLRLIMHTIFNITLLPPPHSAYDLVFLSNYQRDHFFVRARYSHYHKTRTDFGLEYIKGDVFHVIDSKPQGMISCDVY